MRGWIHVIGRRALRRDREVRVAPVAGAFALASVTDGGGAANPQNGVTPALRTGGTPAVWVDSTRVAAAPLDQGQHPDVPVRP